MDAFFASVEQRDDPALRGKPVVVGSSGRRGVIAAASYEAREYGVRSAMSSKIALQKCPHLIFVPHRFDVYKEVSMQIREVFAEYSDLIEPLSLDEAYIDVTENKSNIQSAIKIAREMRTKIKERTHLTASAGVSINKFLAKIASDINKPDGLTVILPDQVESFLEDLPINKFLGVGKVMNERLKSKGILTGKDLKAYDKIALAEQYGKFGLYLYDMVRGIDNRPVKPNRIRKSISNENTYSEDLTTLESVKKAMDELIEGLVKSCRKHDLSGKTVTIKVRDDQFNTLTRSRTLSSYYYEKEIITPLVHEMLDKMAPLPPIRLLGVGLSNLNTERTDIQLKLDFKA